MSAALSTNEVMEDVSLTDNLTGGQIQEVLDTLIHQAVSPIIRTSDVFDLQVIHILGSTTRNRKRKLSSLPRDESIDTMCQFLVSDSGEEKVRLIGAMKLERGFVYNFVVRHNREAAGYIELYQDHVGQVKPDRLVDLRMAAIEASVGGARDTLYMALLNSRDCLELAYKFRNTIVMNYHRHAFKQAKAFVKNKGANFDFKDVHQNFLTAVTKAVDKYDSSKGALTSYVNWWLLNAQTSSNSTHGHEYGIAYTIPQLQKKSLAEKSNKVSRVNFGVSLDRMVGTDEDKRELSQLIAGDVSVETELLGDEELDRVRALAKHADIRGLARLYLDIEEVYSKKEFRKMVRTMRKQLGVVPTKTPDGIRFVPMGPKVKGRGRKKGSQDQTL